MPFSLIITSFLLWCNNMPNQSKGNKKNTSKYNKGYNIIYACDKNIHLVVFASYIQNSNNTHFKINLTPTFRQETCLWWVSWVSKGSHHIVEHNVHKEPVRENNMNTRPEIVCLVEDVWENAYVGHHNHHGCQQYDKGHHYL